MRRLAGAALTVLLLAGCAVEAKAPTSATVPTVTVTKFVDGDTIDVSTGETVRFIGIDTPERGQCGYKDATAALKKLVDGKPVVLAGGARDNADRYGRILRYVSVDGKDVGLEMIEGGWAIARYDSRDGYGRHPKQTEYIRADAQTPNHCVTKVAG